MITKHTYPLFSLIIQPGISLDNHVTVGSEGAIFEDMTVIENGTVVGNPPRVFVSSQDDNFAGEIGGFGPAICIVPSLFCVQDDRCFGTIFYLFV